MAIASSLAWRPFSPKNPAGFGLAPRTTFPIACVARVDGSRCSEPSGCAALRPLRSTPRLLLTHRSMLPLCGRGSRRSALVPPFVALATPPSKRLGSTAQERASHCKWGLRRMRGRGRARRQLCGTLSPHGEHSPDLVDASGVWAAMLMFASEPCTRERRLVLARLRMAVVATQFACQGGFGSRPWTDERPAHGAVLLRAILGGREPRLGRGGERTHGQVWQASIAGGHEEPKGAAGHDSTIVITSVSPAPSDAAVRRCRGGSAGGAPRCAARRCAY